MPASWLAVVNLWEPITQKSRSPPRGGPCIRSSRGNFRSGSRELPRQSNRQSSGDFPLTGEVCANAGKEPALQLVLPRHLRPRREKIFGPAPSRRLDGNAKARLWAAAAAYNNANRQPHQHQGPLTWASLRVLRALLWRFHGADGGGRCFPSYERIAATAKCARSTVALAVRALEEAAPNLGQSPHEDPAPRARPLWSLAQRMAGAPNLERLPVCRPARTRAGPPGLV